MGAETIQVMEAIYAHDFPPGELIYAQDSKAGQYVVLWKDPVDGLIHASPVISPIQKAGLVALILAGDETIRKVILPAKCVVSMVIGEILIEP
jgi:hypothetical protein